MIAKAAGHIEPRAHAATWETGAAGWRDPFARRSRPAQEGLVLTKSVFRRAGDGDAHRLAGQHLGDEGLVDVVKANGVDRDDVD